MKSYLIVVCYLRKVGLPRGFLFILMFGALHCPAFAVLADVSGTTTYLQNPPTDTDIAGWTSGWPAAGITGWDYVGQIGGTSAVYLGDGWVLTAAHVGSGQFVLSGVTYPPVAKSEKSIMDWNGTADLIMFRISPAPQLPPLNLSAEPPALDEPVVMVGYGGGHGKTWGRSRVAGIDTQARSGQAFKTTDFFTSSTDGNKTQLVTGDSGGGAFVSNTSTGRWELAGIGHAIIPNKYSCMAELGHYAWQIRFIRYALLRRLLVGMFVLLIVALSVGLIWKIMRRRHL